MKIHRIAALVGAYLTMTILRFIALDRWVFAPRRT